MPASAHIKCLVAITLLFITSNLPAEIIAKDVVYQVDGQSHTGYLAYDNTITAPRPAVLVVHEWWGLGEYEKRRTRMLAELGYAAFAVDMYGTGKLTNDPGQAREWMLSASTDVEWWRSTALAGIDILTTQAGADPLRIAAIGYCFGGGTVLQLAYGGADLVGVVSFHGSLPAADADAKVKAKILVLHGDADPFIPKDTLERFKVALDKVKADWQLIIYGGVLHSFTNPAANQRGMDALKYDPVADNRSWTAMQNFLHEIFKR